MLERINDDIQHYDRPVLREDLRQIRPAYDMYMEQLLTLDSYQEGIRERNVESVSHRDNIHSLLTCLPDWVSELHLIYLPHFLHQKLTCVKVFSYDLYNCLPLKNNIKKNKALYHHLDGMKNKSRKLPTARYSDHLKGEAHCIT